jgi:hypothetical protein
MALTFEETASTSVGTDLIPSIDRRSRFDLET